MAHQIVFNLLKNLEAKLLLDLQTNVTPGPITLDFISSGGLFQENPAKDKNIFIVLSPGDPDNEKILDGITSLEGMPNIYANFPAREIGGGEIWNRTVTARFGCYFIKSSYDETTALDLATEFVGRMHTSLKSWVPAGITDDFGETAITSYVTNSQIVESGGVSKKTWIWRGKFRLQVITNIN